MPNQKENGGRNVKKAVILAAGMGTRLRPLTNNMPKAFIEINGKPLIKHSLDNLAGAGIKEAVIVIGFMKSMFKEKLGDFYNGIKIKYVMNRAYEFTGSMYSLSQIEIDDDIILLESDLLYEPKAITELLRINEPDIILVAPISGSGDEVFICFDALGNLTELGKKISGQAKGELAGITKLSQKFLQQLFIMAREEYKNGEINQHYEEVIFRLSKFYPINCHFIEDLIWTEIDTENDLRRAKELKSITPP